MAIRDLTAQFFYAGSIISLAVAHPARLARSISSTTPASFSSVVVDAEFPHHPPFLPSRHVNGSSTDSFSERIFTSTVTGLATNGIQTTVPCSTLSVTDTATTDVSSQQTKTQPGPLTVAPSKNADVTIIWPVDVSAGSEGTRVTVNTSDHDVDSDEVVNVDAGMNTGPREVSKSNSPVESHTKSENACHVECSHDFDTHVKVDTYRTSGDRSKADSNGIPDNGLALGTDDSYRHGLKIRSGGVFGSLPETDSGASSSDSDVDLEDIPTKGYGYDDSVGWSSGQSSSETTGLISSNDGKGTAPSIVAIGLSGTDFGSTWDLHDPSNPDYELYRTLSGLASFGTHALVLDVSIISVHQYADADAFNDGAATWTLIGNVSDLTAPHGQSQSIYYMSTTDSIQYDRQPREEEDTAEEEKDEKKRTEHNNWLFGSTGFLGGVLGGALNFEENTFLIGTPGGFTLLGPHPTTPTLGIPVIHVATFGLPVAPQALIPMLVPITDTARPMPVTCVVSPALPNQIRQALNQMGIVISTSTSISGSSADSQVGSTGSFDESGSSSSSDSPPIKSQPSAGLLEKQYELAKLNANVALAGLPTAYTQILLAALEALRRDNNGVTKKPSPSSGNSRFVDPVDADVSPSHGLPPEGEGFSPVSDHPSQPDTGESEHGPDHSDDNRGSDGTQAKKKHHGFWSSLGDSLGALGDIVIGRVKDIWRGITTIKQTVKKIFHSPMDALKDALMTPIRVIESITGVAANVVTDVVTEVADVAGIPDETVAEITEVIAEVAPIGAAVIGAVPIVVGLFSGGGTAVSAMLLGELALGELLPALAAGTALEGAGELAGQVAGQFASKIAGKIAGKVALKAALQAAKQAAKKAAKNAASKISRKLATKFAGKGAKKAALESIEKAALEAAEKAAGKAAVNAAQGAAAEAAEKVVADGAGKIAAEAAEKSTVEAAEKVVAEATEKAAAEAADKAAIEALDKAGLEAAEKGAIDDVGKSAVDGEKPAPDTGIFGDEVSPGNAEGVGLEEGGISPHGKKTGGKETGGEEAVGKDKVDKETGGQENGGKEIDGKDTDGQAADGKDTGVEETGRQETGGKESPEPNEPDRGEELDRKKGSEENGDSDRKKDSGDGEEVDEEKGSPEGHKGDGKKSSEGGEEVDGKEGLKGGKEVDGEKSTEGGKEVDKEKELEEEGKEDGKKGSREKGSEEKEEGDEKTKPDDEKEPGGKKDPEAGGDREMSPEDGKEVDGEERQKAGEGAERDGEVEQGGEAKEEQNSDEGDAEKKKPGSEEQKDATKESAGDTEGNATKNKGEDDEGGTVAKDDEGDAARPKTANGEDGDAGKKKAADEKEGDAAKKKEIESEEEDGSPKESDKQKGKEKQGEEDETTAEEAAEKEKQRTERKKQAAKKKAEEIKAKEQKEKAEELERAKKEKELQEEREKQKKQQEDDEREKEKKSKEEKENEEKDGREKEKGNSKEEKKKQTEAEEKANFRKKLEEVEKKKAKKKAEEAEREKARKKAGEAKKENADNKASEKENKGTGDKEKENDGQDDEADGGGSAKNKADDEKSRTQKKKDAAKKKAEELKAKEEAEEARRKAFEARPEQARDPPSFDTLSQKPVYPDYVEPPIKQELEWDWKQGKGKGRGAQQRPGSPKPDSRPDWSDSRPEAELDVIKEADFYEPGTEYGAKVFETVNPEVYQKLPPDLNLNTQHPLKQLSNEDLKELVKLNARPGSQRIPMQQRIANLEAQLQREALIPKDTWKGQFKGRDIRYFDEATETWRFRKVNEKEYSMMQKLEPADYARPPPQTYYQGSPSRSQWPKGGNRPDLPQPDMRVLEGKLKHGEGELLRPIQPASWMEKNAKDLLYGTPHAELEGPTDPGNIMYHILTGKPSDFYVKPLRPFPPGTTTPKIPSRPYKPPARQDSWMDDLKPPGDLEPNPGPSGSKSWRRFRDGIMV